MRIEILVAGLALLVPTLALAQEEPPSNFVYGTYMLCDLDRQWLVDDVVEKAYKPVYDAAVADGTIKSWGWMGHHSGGQWRRLLYTSAPTMDALLDARAALQKKISAESPMAGSVVSEICGSHDDYIWRGITGSGADLPRGEVLARMEPIEEQGKELNAICNSHTGYIWNILFEKP